MPLKNYGVLKGRASKSKRATSQSEHFQILINVDNDPHRIAINTKSSQAPSQVLYYEDGDFHHEITDLLLQAELEDGFTLLESEKGGLALDFIRGNLFDINEMVPLPSNASGDNDDLNDKMDFFVQQAIQDPSATIYAFGEQWRDANKPDKYFDEINPSTGIHDIHMNQGNPEDGKYGPHNGIYQDGGLLFHFASRNKWAAVFTAFQSQSFHTDDETGHPLNALPIDSPEQPEFKTPIRIIAAMVNPTGEDVTNEYVILLNKSNKTIDLTGWQLADRMKKKDTISNKAIKPGETLRVDLSGDGAKLSNKGGIITLLNKDGLKVDGVTYTKSDASREGEIIEV